MNIRIQKYKDEWFKKLSVNYYSCELYKEDPFAEHFMDTFIVKIKLCMGKYTFFVSMKQRNWFYFFNLNSYLFAVTHPLKSSSKEELLPKAWTIFQLPLLYFSFSITPSTWPCQLNTTEEVVLQVKMLHNGNNIFVNFNIFTYCYTSAIYPKVCNTW